MSGVKERLASALEEVEASNDFMLTDEVAFMIGSFREEDRYGLPIKKGGKIETLLPEMQAMIRPRAMLQLSQYRNDEDLRVLVCDLIIRQLGDQRYY